MRTRSIRLAGLLLLAGLGLPAAVRGQEQAAYPKLGFAEDPPTPAQVAPAPPPATNSAATFGNPPPTASPQGPAGNPLAALSPTGAFGGASPISRQVPPFTPVDADGPFRSAPRVVRGQDYAPPDPVPPLPLYHSHPEAGGLYTFGQFVLFRQTNPLRHQIIAYRGFVDVDGTITGVPGTRVGPFTPALDARDAGGPGTYQPGFKVGLGWRFADGSALEFSWMHLMKAQYFHVATIVPQGLNPGGDLSGSFLFSPVHNFPSDYAGPFNDVIIPGTGTATDAFGIWNAADVMSIEFDQRTDQYELTYRVPVYETEDWRCYGLVGGRFFWIWERFKWRTVDADINGNTQPDWTAIYTNIVSNRMYGPHIGFGNECYLGHGFALSLDLDAALLLDIVKERAKYELGTKNAGPAIKRAITDYTAVPEFSGTLNLWWYPIEGVQVNLGYSAMAFFNTVAGRTPVDFNYGAVAPPWERTFRFFDGLQAGIGFIF